MATALDLANIQSAPLRDRRSRRDRQNGAGYQVTDVGNVTGTGYDSYVVAAPSVSPPTASGTPLGTTSSAVYLVLGTKPVGSHDRVGIANLREPSGPATSGPWARPRRSTPRSTPTTPATLGFQFDGLTFVPTRAATGLGQLAARGVGRRPGRHQRRRLRRFHGRCPERRRRRPRLHRLRWSALANSDDQDRSTSNRRRATTRPPTHQVVSFSLSTAATARTASGTAVAGIGNFFAGSSTGLGNSLGDVAIGDPTYGGTGGGFRRLRDPAQLAGRRHQRRPRNPRGRRRDRRHLHRRHRRRPGRLLDHRGQLRTRPRDSGSTAISSLLIGAPGAVGSAGHAYLVYGTQVAAVELGARGHPIPEHRRRDPDDQSRHDADLGDHFQRSDGRVSPGLCGGEHQRLRYEFTDDIAIGAPGSGTASSGSAATGYVAPRLRPTVTTATPRVNGIFSIDPTSTTAGLTTSYYTGENAGDLAGYSLAR